MARFPWVKFFGAIILIVGLLIILGAGNSTDGQHATAPTDVILGGLLALGGLFLLISNTTEPSAIEPRFVEKDVVEKKTVTTIKKKRAGDGTVQVVEETVRKDIIGGE